jgi:hypothetical protein
MYNYIQKFAFYKNTYGKPFLIRIVFEVKLPGNCLMVADNICKCDSWFVKDSSVKIKYNIVHSGEIEHHKPSSIKKSIVVDLNASLNEDLKLELVVSNNAGLSDVVSSGYSALKPDTLKHPRTE